jgi:hypothetical protein
MEQRTQPEMSLFTKVLAALALVGALNWGLIGFFEWNLLGAVLEGQGTQEVSGLVQFVYIAVGLAGVALLFTFPWVRRGPPGASPGRERLPA